MLGQTSKISLLEEYCASLQRENFAKNSEIGLLHDQNASMIEENAMLKSCIESMRHEWESERARYNSLLQQRHQQDGLLMDNLGQQLLQSVDYGALRAVAEEMRQELDEKQRQLRLIENEKQLWQEQMCCLKNELASTISKVVGSEQRSRRLMEVNKELENQLHFLKSKQDEGKSGFSFSLFQSDKVIKEKSTNKKNKGEHKQNKAGNRQQSPVSLSRALLAEKQIKSPQKISLIGRCRRANNIQQIMRALKSPGPELRTAGK